MRSFLKVLVLAFGLFMATYATAVEPFTIKDIRAEGLQRVEAGTVFATLPFRTGDTFTDEKGASAIRALFALGLFKDVRLDAKDGVLIVAVEERPTIAELAFVGAKEFDKDKLSFMLRQRPNNQPELNCFFNEDIYDDVDYAFSSEDVRVVIQGRLLPNRSNSLEVIAIEIIEPEKI